VPCLDLLYLRVKCKAAVRKCDLGCHNENNHDGVPQTYHRQETRPRSALEMFRAFTSPPTSKRPKSETDLPLVESMEDSTSQDGTSSEERGCNIFGGSSTKTDEKEDEEGTEWNDFGETELVAFIP
jgi:hypothetical protein